MHSDTARTSLVSSKPIIQQQVATPEERKVKHHFERGVRQMRILVFIGVILTGHFLWWFADSDHMGYPLLFWLLTTSLCFKLLRMLHEWYHYVQVSNPVKPAHANYQYSVDVLTTACPGEPLDMIERTLRAMQAIRYPHANYLCDEGDDPYLRQLCQELGIIHVTRTKKVNAKAGNINNALRQATGELCVVLDPDHEPTPDFLDKVVDYFADPTVGYVQVVQAYGNQQESLIARGAAEQTYHFYGPLMMGMNTYNTAQAIGANCTFRRVALDSIGGHAAGLTEDMHTAMRLHAKGWKSVYAPVIVSRGLVPASLAAYYAQQLKWARGSFELLLRVYPTLFSRFTWRQRLHYLTLPLYFFSGIIAFIDLLVPILALSLGEFPWHLSLPQFVLHMTPIVAISLLIRYNAQRWLREPHEAGLHLTGGLLRIGTWWIYCLGFIYTLLRIRVPYIPTPKNGHVGNEWLLSLPNLLVAAVCVAAARYGHYLMQTPYALLMMALAMGNAVILGVSVLIAQHNLLESTLRIANSFSPIRWLISKFKQILWGGGQELFPRLRTAAIYIAFFVFIAHSFISLGVDLWLDRTTSSPDLIWTRSGVGAARVGYTAAVPTMAPAALSLPPLAEADSASPIQEIRLAPALGPQITVESLKKADALGTIPLLSWQVTDGSFDEAAWKQSVNAIRSHNHPVMLRPLIKASTPAAYRRTWQRLVTHFRASGDTSAVWVWTPPVADSIAAYFPGAVYIDWVAAECMTSGPDATAKAMQKYRSLRFQFAQRAELTSIPVILLAPVKPTQSLHAQSQQWTSTYEEIKAVLFGLPYAQSDSASVKLSAFTPVGIGD